MTEISIEGVLRGERIRQIDEDRVTALMASIREVGLLNPITVTPCSIARGGRTQSGWLLIAGLHRLVVMERLGHKTIAVNVMVLTEPAAVIAQCDENLCGPNLSAAERALFTKHRKLAYLELHPETKSTRDGGEGRRKQTRRQLGDDTFDRFTADTATKTGQPERTIQRDAQRGERIPEPILAQVACTDLDRGVILDRLAKAASPDQELVEIKRERELRKRNKPADKWLPQTDAEHIAALILERSDPAERSRVLQQLKLCKPTDLRRAVMRGPMLAVQPGSAKRRQSKDRPPHTGEANVQNARLHDCRSSFRAANIRRGRMVFGNLPGIDHDDLIVHGDDWDRDRVLTFHWRMPDPRWLSRLDLPAIDKRRLRRARDAILLEALVAYHGGWPGVSYSRRQAFYSGRRRYCGTDFTFATVVPTVDGLASDGLLHSWIAPANPFLGRQSVFSATPKLLGAVSADMLANVEHRPIELGRVVNCHWRPEVGRW